MLSIRVIRAYLLMVLTTIALLFCAGCGGGGGSNTSAPSVTQCGTVQVSVVWPQRGIGRFIPQATNSIVLKLDNGAGFTQTQTIQRSGNSTATFSQVPAGTVAITTNAFASTDGSGVSQAVSMSTAPVTYLGTTPVTLDMTSTIASVSIDQYPTSSIAAGTTAQLIATAHTAQGNVVPVLPQPNGFYWSSSNPNVASVDQTGLLTAYFAGSTVITAQESETGVKTTVTVQVTGGAQSGSLLISISNNPITAVVTPATAKVLAGATKQFSATVSGVKNQGVIWSVQEPGGGMITPAGLYTAPSYTGVFHVVGTSIASPSITASATVTVAPNAAYSNNLNIFAADSGNNRIVGMNDMTGAGWTTFGGPAAGKGVNQFNNPVSVALDSSGHIYIADYGNNRIVRMNDLTGAGWTTLGGPTAGSGVNQFTYPRKIAIGPDGKIYVADNSRIVCMDDITGKNWGTLSYSMIGSVIGDVALAPSGKIYVTFPTVDEIVSMNDMTTAGLTSLNGNANYASYFSNPSSIAIGPDGKIYMVDSLAVYLVTYPGGRIVCINDMTGAGWTAIGTVNSSQSIFPGYLSSITTGPDGKIYVVEYLSSRASYSIVCLNDISGTTMTTCSGYGADTFSSIGGLAVRLAVR